MIAPERVLLSMSLVVSIVPAAESLTVYYCRTGSAVRQITSSDRFTIRPRADPANPGRRNSTATVIPPVVTVTADLNADLRVHRHGCSRRFRLDGRYSNDAGTQNKCG